ncbi:hypothetical protein GTO89_04680 [Heliobacterium gestii]|uniref:Uncharacterized protein n=1 Tax=Heliomicrobium gestii TaxID=2699 RepID=A0A845LHJ4_HELGE|nr:hypothetical protein [Heliomicrobium gestii]MBM7866909.1 NRPS condensation-like uncharacterized protein [Heliomicrobium gestii]MZP42336.1 hypothetical protein [Heliomicrobium gestii]
MHKNDHASSDAGGLKHCLGLLASMYSRLCAEPATPITSRAGGRRDGSQVIERLRIEDVRTAWDGGSGEKAARSVPFPFLELPCLQPDFAIERLEPESYARLVAYARRRDVTMNDILLTAFYRALLLGANPRLAQPALLTEHVPVQVTVDLRRYLPGRRAESICNLSGIVTPLIKPVLDEPFEGTLSRVSAAMKKHKAHSPGFKTTLLLELYSRIGYSAFLDWLVGNWRQSMKHRSSPPLFSNIGMISEGKIAFGPCLAIDGYMIGPAMQAPSSLIAISTYNQRLTLAMAFYKPAVPVSKVTAFLKCMIREMHTCI